MDISVIIVNWNTRGLLRDCLESVERTISDMTYEVIVVDNASADDSVAMVKESFPRVMIISNSENRGFAAANNQALKIMAGRYALLLNSDTVLTEGAVRGLFSFMEGRPDAAMACGQLLNRDGSKQNSIACFPTLLTLITNTSLLEYLFPQRYPSKRYGHQGPVEIDSAIGACLMARRRAIEDIGPFDERYFFFFEETDWAYRMKRGGWKIYHIPGASIYHLQGQSVGSDIRSRIAFYRSRYQFFKKWHSRFVYLLISLVIFLRLLINWLLTATALLLTLGLHRGMRSRWMVYSRLILWHFYSPSAGIFS